MRAFMIDIVSNQLLTANDLNVEQLHQYLAIAHKHDIDFSDLYFQDAQNETWVLEDGILKEGSFNIECGLGVRAISGEKTGFAYADEISLSALKSSVEAARSIASAGQEKKIPAFSKKNIKPVFPSYNPLESCSSQEKINLLKELDAYIRTLDSRIIRVVVSLSSVFERVLVCASDETLAADIRPLTRLNCSVVLEDGDTRERGSSGGGGRHDYQVFLQPNVDGELSARWYAREAVRQAQVGLEAAAAPAGEMPVVLGAGWPGVLLHEAVGHGLEGDFNRRGSSTFSGRIGEQVASEHVTVVDDGTIKDRRGSLSIDDEGTQTQHNVLIENGILKGYMQDKLNAYLMGQKSTGNGRRESYAHLPMPRMTNTFMLSGDYAPEEIIGSVKKGIYAPNFGGGQVDITSGKFVFSASEAYLIENGKVTQPVKGATLIGNGPESMHQISMVGNDLALDKGVGVCGKDGQSVPVSVGQPTLKIDKMTVGGTA